MRHGQSGHASINRNEAAFEVPGKKSSRVKRSG
jgi:hypothetical protein